jgi:putative phage-type endonuclease
MDNMYDIKCTDCGETTTVSASCSPNFCAMCGSRNIVIRGEFGLTEDTNTEQEKPMAYEEKKETGRAIGVHIVNTVEPDWSAPDRTFRFEVKDAPEQGTDKWLAWRKQGITATEAASIMYPSKWGSPLSIYTDKLGLTNKSQDDSEGFMEWGHRIEDLLVSKFMEQHTDFKDCTQGRLYQRDWAKCSLDAQAFDADGEPCIIECKTGQHEDKWDPIPERYYAQVQWQMYVTGIRKAYFSVLIQGHIWFERVVEYCPEYVSKLLNKCFYVWDCVQRREAPATLGDFESDATAIAAIAGDTGHSGKPLEVDNDLVGKYIALKEAYEKAEQEFKEFKNSIGLEMVDHSKAVCDGKTFATWVERKGAVSVDKKLLEAKYPVIYKECLKQGAPTRYIKYNV